MRLLLKCEVNEAVDKDGECYHDVFIKNSTPEEKQPRSAVGSLMHIIASCLYPDFIRTTVFQ